MNFCQRVRGNAFHLTKHCVEELPWRPFYVEERSGEITTNSEEICPRIAQIKANDSPLVQFSRLFIRTSDFAIPIICIIPADRV